MQDNQNVSSFDNPTGRKIDWRALQKPSADDDWPERKQNATSRSIAWQQFRKMLTDDWKEVDVKNKKKKISWADFVDKGAE